MADEKKATTTRGAQSTDGTVEQTPTPTYEKKSGYAPIEPADDKENPVKVAVPKTAGAIAKEGTALGQADAEATGGSVPFLAPADAEGKRVWALDADHNVNLRNGGPGSETAPDLVEFGV